MINFKEDTIYVSRILENPIIYLLIEVYENDEKEYQYNLMLTDYKGGDVNHQYSIGPIWNIVDDVTDIPKALTKKFLGKDIKLQECQEKEIEQLEKILHFNDRLWYLTNYLYSKDTGKIPKDRTGSYSLDEAISCYEIPPRPLLQEVTFGSLEYCSYKHDIPESKILTAVDELPIQYHLESISLSNVLREPSYDMEKLFEKPGFLNELMILIKKYNVL